MLQDGAQLLGVGGDGRVALQGKLGLVVPCHRVVVRVAVEDFVAVVEPILEARQGKLVFFRGDLLRAGRQSDQAARQHAERGGDSHIHETRQRAGTRHAAPPAAPRAAPQGGEPLFSPASRQLKEACPLTVCDLVSRAHGVIQSCIACRSRQGLRAPLPAAGRRSRPPQVRASRAPPLRPPRRTASPSSPGRRGRRACGPAPTDSRRPYR